MTREPSASDFLKNTFHLLVASPATDGLSLAHKVSDWLLEASASKPSSLAMASHRSELDSRAAGGRSIPEVARQAGLPIAVARAMTVLLRNYGFATFDLGSLAVSVDIFNAAAELGAEPWQMVEIFVVGGSANVADELCHLAVTAVDDLGVDPVAGGYSAFTASYVVATRNGHPSDPSHYLWPVHHMPGVYACDRPHLKTSRGVLVQVFPDLTNGPEDYYSTLASELGTTSLWDRRLQRRAR